MGMTMKNEGDKVTCLFKKYSKVMFFTANNVLKDDYLAEDAVQKAFIKIMDNIEKVGDVESLKTKAFCSIIAKREALSILEKQRYKNVVFLEETLEPEEELQEGCLDTILHNQEYEGLVELVNNLPDKHRDVFWLHHSYGRSFKEIGELLSVTEENARQYHNRARQKLIKAIKNEERKYE